MTKQEIQDLLILIELSADRLGPNQVKELYRIAMFLGYPPVCPGCGMPIATIGEFSWDHIYPRSKGGSSYLSNLQPMHKTCNTLKSDMIDDWHEVCALHYENLGAVQKNKKNKKHKKNKKNQEMCNSMKKINSYLNDNHHNHKHK